MRKSVLVVALLILGSVAAARSDAQAAVRVGIDVAVNNGEGVDPSIGVTWHLGRRVALRPQFRYIRSEYRPQVYSFTATGASGSSAVATNEVPTETTEGWGGGLDLLYYLGRTSDLSPYLFAGLDVSWATDTTSGSTSAPALERKTTGKGWRTGLGLQYGLKDKLAVFGELGLRRNWTDQYSYTSTFSSTLGIRFYLK